MRVPEHFAYAFSGLEAVLEGLASGGVSEERAGREAIRWMREDALGSLALCKAAIFAKRHEAASGGVPGDAGAAQATLRALGLIERAVDPPEDPNFPLLTPTPAHVPDALRRRAPEARVYRMGKTQILAEPGESRGWHLSVSHPDRFPTLREMVMAAGVTGETGATFAALLPPASELADGRGFVVHVLEAASGGTEGSGG